MSDYDLTRRLELFPLSAAVEPAPEGERLTIAGCDLHGLAEQYGTPLYLYDQGTLDAALESYRQALAAAYPGESGITYAGKAFLCVAMAQWVGRRGLWLDCAGVGELAVAAAARLPREQVVAHGVNKSPADLAAALSLAGTLVVDNLAELDQLVQLARERQGPWPNLWLRLRPGYAVATHAHNQTGQEDSKFGMSPAETAEAVRICCKRSLPLTGLHFHLGSQFRDPSPVGQALDTLLDLVAAQQAENGWSPQVISPGGGWGVAYHEDDLPHPPLNEYVQVVAARLADGCRRRGLPLPRLHLEPGRRMVARAGVALYRVGSVKRTAFRRWLLLDGGLADNPRHALYGTRYSALPVQQPGRPANGTAWLAGPYCESGDVIIEDLPMPDIGAGELIAVPMSGAYHLSLANNYNGACRPAVVWLQGETSAPSSRLVRRRETVDDLIRRDISL
jgi:diaminopimelate decarboxylase